MYNIIYHPHSLLSTIRKSMVSDSLSVTFILRRNLAKEIGSDLKLNAGAVNASPEHLPREYIVRQITHGIRIRMTPKPRETSDEQTLDGETAQEIHLIYLPVDCL
jgi:hypothetical protein